MDPATGTSTTVRSCWYKRGHYMSLRIPKPFLALVLAMALAIGLLPATAGAAPGGGGEIKTLQILQYSDWHGQLDPIGGVGGAAVLSAYFKADEANNSNTLIITGGDDFGAAPPLSSFFGEEPAVLAQNLMGTDVAGLGNHNFDKGTAHLAGLLGMASYTYVSANLTNLGDNGLEAVKPFEIFDVGGVKVAVIGITNPEAPTLVFPGSFGTINITSPASAANKARSDAAKAGAQVFILVAHMGVRGFDTVTNEPFGELIDLANSVGNFDLVLGDHTDVSYVGTHNGKLVTEARSKGIEYNRISLDVRLKNGKAKVVSSSVETVAAVASAVTPDPAIVALLQPYRDLLGPIFNAQVGTSTVFIPRADACGRSDGRLCESLVGNTTTDAMRVTYGTDFAITNSGGLRANLTCPTVDNPTDFCPSYTPLPYPITRGQVLTVLPFGNIVTTLTVNGAELKTYLENGVSALPGANGRFAQVSGLCFSYDISASAGSRVTSALRQAADGSCTGAAVDLTAASNYSLAINDFMASGGDGYLNVVARAVTRDFMDQVLADYVGASSPISPSIQGRIACTTSGATACPVILP